MKFSCPTDAVAKLQVLAGESLEKRIVTRWTDRLGRLGETAEGGEISVRTMTGSFERLAL